MIGSGTKRQLRGAPANLPVVLYIARFHPSFQGFSGIYSKFIRFSPGAWGRRGAILREWTPPVGAAHDPGPSNWVVKTDGAAESEARPKLAGRRTLVVCLMQIVDYRGWPVRG